MRAMIRDADIACEDGAEFRRNRHSAYGIVAAGEKPMFVRLSAQGLRFPALRVKPIAGVSENGGSAFKGGRTGSLPHAD